MNKKHFESPKAVLLKKRSPDYYPAQSKSASKQDVTYSTEAKVGLTISTSSENIDKNPYLLSKEQNLSHSTTPFGVPTSRSNPKQGALDAKAQPQSEENSGKTANGISPNTLRRITASNSSSPTKKNEVKVKKLTKLSIQNPSEISKQETQSPKKDTKILSQNTGDEPFSSYGAYLSRLSRLANSSSLLPEMERSKFSERSHGLIRTFCACTNQGLVRNYNEDRVSIILNLTKIGGKQNKKDSFKECHFFGVYDGHGGNRCAEFCRNNLHQYIVKSKHFPSNPQEALREGFEEADREFLEMVMKEYQQTGVVDRSGSCAIVALLIDNIFYIANLGDSRAVASLNHGTQVNALTRDLKPSDKQEQRRIELAGGKVYQYTHFYFEPSNIKLHYRNFPMSPKGQRLDLDPATNPFEVVIPYRVHPGRLSVSRAIGDAEAKIEKFGGNPNVVISTPEVFKLPISPEQDFILMGSDGIFEKATNEELISVVWKQMQLDANADQDLHQFAKVATEGVVKESLLKKSLDNVTALLLFLPGFEEKFKQECETRRSLNRHSSRNKLKLDQFELPSSLSPVKINTPNRASEIAFGFDKKAIATSDEKTFRDAGQRNPLRSSHTALPVLHSPKAGNQPNTIASAKNKQKVALNSSKA